MYNLTDEMINENKETFISILSDALSRREGCNVEGLFTKLDASDFYTAPASTKYHACYKGGLVDHSLNVYYNMMSLAKNKHLLEVYETQVVETEEGPKEQQVVVEGEINSDSIAIVALLHDFSKMNYYTTTYKNQKVYCETGSKKDENGRFDWVSVPGYAVLPPEERFLYGNHEQTAEFMIRQFVPLTYMESAAIINHHFTLSYDSTKDAGTVGNIYERYPLASLLHIADFLSTYVDERRF